MYIDFSNECLSLANSIVIKDHDFAKAIEAELVPEPADDLRQWRYYLNISGEYHPSNEPMYVTSLDTLEEIEFTKQNLQIHKSTKRSYLQEEKYLVELNSRYPDNTLLINGILNPLDIDYVVNAPNYTILSYDNKLIEYQEVSLIDRLQQKINDTIDVWYNKEFTLVDKNYFLAFYRHIISSLPLFIMQIREENEFTHEVHSYYLWSYLEIDPTYWGLVYDRSKSVC